MKPCTQIILGPPGTGKTHTLLSIMEELLISNKVMPDTICFVSFTRKAANEALDRAVAKFEIKKTEFPWIRTLHSLAFQFHHVQSSDVMGWSDYLNIANMLGLTITSTKVEEGSYGSTTTKGDRLFFMENLSRATGRTLREIWEQYINDDIAFEELELLATTLLKYKEIRSKIDFTDMIENFVKIGQVPNIKALIVDEAQDLSPLQWKMIELLARDVEHFYVAGDDDQAIYTWAGAEVEKFLALEGPKRVLSQSYRVPKDVFVIADKIVQTIRVRNKKPYLPRDAYGRVQRHDDISTIDMSQGNWLVLSRNLAFLPPIADYCISKGFIFECKHGSPISSNEMKAIVFWERLRRNIKIPAAEAKNVYKFIGVRTGVKFGFKKKLDAVDDATLIDIEVLNVQYGLLTNKLWREAFDKMEASHVTYFVEALKRGEKFGNEPRIKINTIHSVKGGEADNVVLISDVTKRTYEECQRHPDDEARVWYVGVTRTKSNLYIVNPRTAYSYEF